MFDIYTYGDATTLVAILKGIAFVTAKFRYLLIFSVLLGLVILTLESVFSNDLLSMNIKFLLVILGITTAIVATKTPVKIIDKSSYGASASKVENVPFGLAIIASMSSKIGNGLTELFEHSFPDNRKFENHGMLFAVKLLASSSLFEIQNYNFRRSMVSFAHQCMIKGVVANNTLSFNQLSKSNDLWQLAQDETWTGTFTNWEQSATKITKNHVSCSNGWATLNKRLTQSMIDKTAIYYGKRIFPFTKAGTGEILKAQLPLAYISLLGVDKKDPRFGKFSNFTYLMRQAMLVNALRTKNDFLLFNSFVDRSQLQHKSFWDMLGANATTIFSLISAFLYAVFPLVVVAAIIFGVAILKNYLLASFAAQTTPVFFAAINMFVTNRASAFYRANASGGLTFDDQANFTLFYHRLSTTAGVMELLSLAMILVIYWGIKTASTGFRDRFFAP